MTEAVRIKDVRTSMSACRVNLWGASHTIVKIFRSSLGVDIP